MTNISEEVLNRIKENHIKPRGRWEFLLKKYFVWALSILFVVVGGLATSVVIHLLNTNDWDLYRNVSDSFWTFLLLTLPYFWILLFIIFAFVVSYNIRHTNKGYNYPLSVIIIISITASIALGGAFYNFGFGHKLDRTLTAATGPYNRVFCHNTVVWQRPAAGMIVGEIVGVEKQVCYLIDMDGNQWEVSFDRANFPPSYSLMPGDRVKVMGEIVGPGRIRAFEIRPFEIKPTECGCKQKDVKDSCGCERERKINQRRIIDQMDILSFNY